MKLDKARVRLLVLAETPLLLGSAIGSAVLSSGYIGLYVRPNVEYSIHSLLVQAIVSTILGSLVVGALYWVLRSGGYRTRRVIVAFVVSPILGFVAIFVGETLLLVMFKGTMNVLHGVLLLFSIGVSLFSLVLIVVDIAPRLLRSLFVIFYGSVFGTFLGVTMLTSTVLVVMVSVVIEDYVLTRYHPQGAPEVLLGSPGKDPFEYARVQMGGSAIGAGDFVVYSLLTAHAIAYFPTYVWGMTLLLATLGVAINSFILAREQRVLPGIPLPTLLAVFPWAVHLTVLPMLT